MPVFFYKKNFINFYFFLKKNIIVLFLFSIFLIYFFDYQISFTGGGLFFNLSNYIFGNNYFFYIVSLISLSFVLYLSKLDVRNFYFFLLLILTNVQNTIYHKYYEPLLFIIFFTLLKNAHAELIVNDRKSIYSFYSVSILFIVMQIYKNYYVI